MNRIDVFRDYLLQKPGDRFAMYSLALELCKAERWTEAEAAFQELIAAHPQSGAGHYQFGMLYRAQERYTEALAAWNQGLAALQGTTDREAMRSIAEIEAAIEEVEDEL